MTPDLCALAPAAGPRPPPAQATPFRRSCTQSLRVSWTSSPSATRAAPWRPAPHSAGSSATNSPRAHPTTPSPSCLRRVPLRRADPQRTPPRPLLPTKMPAPTPAACSSPPNCSNTPEHATLDVDSSADWFGVPADELRLAHAHSSQLARESCRRAEPSARVGCGSHMRIEVDRGDRRRPIDVESRRTSGITARARPTATHEPAHVRAGDLRATGRLEDVTSFHRSASFDSRRTTRLFSGGPAGASAASIRLRERRTFSRDLTSE